MHGLGDPRIIENHTFPYIFIVGNMVGGAGGSGFIEKTMVSMYAHEVGGGGGGPGARSIIENHGLP